MSDINKFTKERANYLWGLKRWKRSLCIGKFRIYVTYNWRMKTRNRRDILTQVTGMSKFRNRVYKRSGCRCEACGSELKRSEMQLHHVLPLGRFKFLAQDERNMQCLCQKCHNSIHCNPYKEIAQMEDKAKELGIDLKEYYGA